MLEEIECKKKEEQEEKEKKETRERTETGPETGRAEKGKKKERAIIYKPIVVW